MNNPVLFVLEIGIILGAITKHYTYELTHNKL